MTKNELLQIIKKYYCNAEIKNKVISINEIDIDIEPTNLGYIIYLGDFHRKKVATLQEVLKEIGVKNAK